MDITGAAIIKMGVTGATAKGPEFVRRELLENENSFRTPAVIIPMRMAILNMQVLRAALLATYVAVAVGSSQLMICFHRDGGSQIELAAIRCCDDESQSPDPFREDGCSNPGTSSCPDDDCEDIALVLISPALHAAPTVQDLAIPLVDLPAITPLWTPLEVQAGPAEIFPSSLEHPPERGPKDHLRTVILRI